jgi:anti-anti-sigma factor
MEHFSLGIEALTSPKVVIFRANGYLDQTSGPEFKEKVLQNVPPRGTALLFNLTKTPVINSCGLAALMDTLEEISFERHGEIQFCGLSRTVNDVFRMVGLSALFPLHPTEAEAVKFIAETSR